VIDAGWYAERNEDWSSTVGAWQPSKTRWPRGVRFLLDRIREKGIPGLWLEPEVAGKHSALAEEPDTGPSRPVANSHRIYLLLRQPRLTSSRGIEKHTVSLHRLELRRNPQLLAAQER
jgi:alpha-galactosidase